MYRHAANRTGDDGARRPGAGLQGDGDGPGGPGAQVIHLIECETLRGFHASAAGVTPAPSDKKSQNGEDALLIPPNNPVPLPAREGVRG